MALEFVPNQPVRDLPNSGGAAGVEEMDFDAHMASVAGEDAKAKEPAPDAKADPAPADDKKPAADKPEEKQVAKPEAENFFDDPTTGEKIDKRTGEGKRIFRLIQRTHDAEDRARRAEARAAALEVAPKPDAKVADTKAADAKADPTRPRMEEFTDTAEYIEAVSDWKVQQALASDRAARQTEQNQRELQRQNAVIAEREESFASTHADYRSVVSTVQDEINAGCAVNHPTAKALAEVMRTHELGPAMAYALGKDPEAHKRLAALPPLAAVVELRQLVQDAPKPKADEKVKEAVRSRAPEPPEEVQGKSSASDPDPMAMDFDTQFEHGNRADAARARTSSRRRTG